MQLDFLSMAEKIGYLDSLRGVAALTVVLCHFGFAFYQALLGDLTSKYNSGFESLLYNTPVSILFNGRFAIFIFFVLSGYVLTYKFFSTGDQAILKSSAIRRYFRLLPPVLLSLLCTLVIILLFLSFISAVSDLTGIAYLKSYFCLPPDLFSILRQAFWGSFFDPNVTYNSVLWTMGVEFIGSMLVFTMAGLFGKTPNRWVFYLGAGLFLLNTYYLSFLLGMLLADMYNGESRKRFGIPGSVILLLVLGAGLFLGSWYNVIPGEVLQVLIPGISLNTTILFPCIGAFLVLLALLNSDQLKKILSNKYLIFLGNISFSMYLMHEIVFGTFTTLLVLVLVNIFHLPYLSALKTGILRKIVCPHLCPIKT